MKEDLLNLKINGNTKPTYELVTKVKEIINKCKDKGDLEKWYKLRNKRNTIETIIEYVK